MVGAGESGIELQPIGRVESPLGDPAEAPKQGDEGAPRAVLRFDPSVTPGLAEVSPGAEMILLTWLDRADREVLAVHPRGDPSRPAQGVFTTRSPDRPNPIGLHRVTVVTTDLPRIEVDGLEAVDGTPVLDLKPVLEPVAER